MYQNKLPNKIYDIEILKKDVWTSFKSLNKTKKMHDTKIKTLKIHEIWLKYYMS